jgi:hypothetical protein
MSEKLSQIFKKVEELEPNPGLFGAVLHRMLEKTRKTRMRRAISELGFVFSALATVWVSATFGSEILQSEFWKIMSLAFSDLGIIAGDWKSYLYSLMETFPAIYAAAIAAPIFTLLLSINGYLNNHNHNSRYSTA